MCESYPAGQSHPNIFSLAVSLLFHLWPKWSAHPTEHVRTSIVATSFFFSCTSARPFDPATTETCHFLTPPTWIQSKSTRHDSFFFFFCFHFTLHYLFRSFWPIPLHPSDAESLDSPRPFLRNENPKITDWPVESSSRQHLPLELISTAFSSGKATGPPD